MLYSPFSALNTIVSKLWQLAGRSLKAYAVFSYATSPLLHILQNKLWCLCCSWIYKKFHRGLRRQKKTHPVICRLQIQQTSRHSCLLNLGINHTNHSDGSWKLSGLETIYELKYADFEHALRHGREKGESPLRAGIIQTALAGVSSSHWARGTAELLGEGKGACTAILQWYARHRKFERVVPAIPACLVVTAPSLTRLCQ